MKENVQAARLLEIKDQLARSKLGHGSIPSLKPFRAKGPMKGRVKGTRTPKDSTLTPSMELVTAGGNRPTANSRRQKSMHSIAANTAREGRRPKTE